MANFLKYINIEEFLSKSYIVNKMGLPFVNRFVCELSAENQGSFDTFPFQVLSCDVPNFALAYNEIELFGEKRFNFKNREDGDLGITFLETPDLVIRGMFYTWMNDAYKINNDGTVSRKYMDQVATGTQLTVFPLDPLGNTTLVDRFIDVIPYDISGIPYTYSDTEVIKTTIKFKYKYHHLTTYKSHEPYKQGE